MKMYICLVIHVVVIPTNLIYPRLRSLCARASWTARKSSNEDLQSECVKREAQCPLGYTGLGIW